MGVSGVRLFRFGRFLGVAGVLFLTGTASAAATGSTDPGIAQFKPFVVKGIAQCLANAKLMRDKIAANDLLGAQRAWIGARAGWEQAEVITDEFFPDLDDAIDSWPNGKTGFHAVEARLFGAHKTDALAPADELVRNLTLFDQRLQTTVITPQGLLNGLTKLAFEVGSNKADGGESQFAGTSLADMTANLDGIRTAYRMVFSAKLKVKDAALDARAQKDIEKLAVILKVADLKHLDPDALLDASEDLAAALQTAAPPLGLAKPNLGD
jgi:iron uptake system component EfeO